MKLQNSTIEMIITNPIIGIHQVAWLPPRLPTSVRSHHRHPLIHELLRNIHRQAHVMIMMTFSQFLQPITEEDRAWKMLTSIMAMVR